MKYSGGTSDCGVHFSVASVRQLRCRLSIASVRVRKLSRTGRGKRGQNRSGSRPAQRKPISQRLKVSLSSATYPPVFEQTIALGPGRLHLPRWPRERGHATLRPTRAVRTYEPKVQMTDASTFITFVLGAGSSFEVSMPTGDELKSRIARALSFESGRFGTPKGGDDQVCEALERLSQRSGSQARSRYFAAAELISAAMPQAPSIDNFIDSHRSNSLVAEVGKVAIASEILKAERASKLYTSPNSNGNRLDFTQIKDSWFNSFFQLVALNAQEEDLPDRLQRVRVVSFNYDRTLEHFLFHSIQNYYRSSPERAADILKNLVIFHPYGKVGNLPWQNTGTSVPFGGDMHCTALLQVSTGLRTFTEGTSETESQIDSIRTTVFDAEILAFLGFAYHELNLELLFGVSNPGPARPDKLVFGTARGLSESNKIAIARELSTLGRYKIAQVTLRRELTAARLLPEYSRSLRIPSGPSSTEPSRA